MTEDDKGSHPAAAPIPAFLNSRSHRIAFGACFVVIVLAIIKHATLGLGFREPSIWSAIAAAAALTAAIGIPWHANRSTDRDSR